MKKRCYINGMACISAQKTFDAVFMEGMIVNRTANVLPAVPPDYKEFILPAAGRRMATGVKNGIAASARALSEAGVAVPDAIITGTGMGCNIDSQAFLKSVIDNKEEFLTPTSFIQSTHNTVGAQIALGLQCKGYNTTYVNGAVSFETVLLDAKLQLEEEEAATVLAGGIEELEENRVRFLELAGMIKDSKDTGVTILESITKGAVFSEGAMFLVLAGEKQQSTYAELRDVSIFNALQKEEVPDKLKAFLKSNDLEINDIDAIVLGYNGDAGYDAYYSTLTEALFTDIPQLYYKHLSGEHNSASAFGLFVAANIMKLQQIPPMLKVNRVEVASFRTILLYNQYRGKDHSFTLISRA